MTDWNEMFGLKKEGRDPEFSKVAIAAMEAAKKAQALLSTELLPLGPAEFAEAMMMATEMVSLYLTHRTKLAAAMSAKVVGEKQAQEHLAEIVARREEIRYALAEADDLYDEMMKGKPQ